MGVRLLDADEVVLWYDTPVGRAGQHFATYPGAPLQRTVHIEIPPTGLGREPSNGRRLDYWWAVLADGKVLQRRSGVVVLPSNLTEQTRIIPAPPTQQRWSEAATKHYRLRYYPGSPAERDIDQIERDAEAAFSQASKFITPTEPLSITVYLVPRVFWQGGVAYDGSTVMVTYADRNYAGVELKSYLTHETVHALAHGLVEEHGEIGGLIGEGIATYATGGHYGPEPLDAWAATLSDSDRFVPLCRIRADFPKIQHEIAYIEGASFVGYLIRTYGLERFQRFYAQDPQVPSNAADDIDAFCATEVMRPVAEFGKSYGELESEWRAYLATLKPTADERALFWGQTRYFDLVRTYEERYDQDARILPPPPGRWNERIYQAFATPAMTETNTIIEAMFIAADHALDTGRVVEANAALDEIATMLDTGTIDGTLGNTYKQITSLLRRYGRAQRLGDEALQSTVATAAVAPPQDELWSEYDMSLQSVQLYDTWGIVRVKRRSRHLRNTSGQEAGLRVHIVRQYTGWRISSIQPDPARPSQPWMPNTPTATNRTIAYNGRGPVRD